VSDLATPPRVVIADDQALVRSGFRMILGAAGIPVVGEAADGGQALAAVLEHRPYTYWSRSKVVRMMTRQPAPAGPATICRVASRPSIPGIRMSIRTMSGRAHRRRQRVLLRDVSPEQLVDAVRTIRSGDALLAPSITRRLVERFASPELAPPAEAGPPAVHGDLSDLTPRELEVLQLLARGLSNAELAAELVLSEATVKTHVARILRKLGLRDRVQAVVLAYQTGLAAAQAGTGS
jgi:DNA-binding NarL/FixJ family response regulator